MPSVKSSRVEDIKHAILEGQRLEKKRDLKTTKNKETNSNRTLPAHHQQDETEVAGASRFEARAKRARLLDEHADEVTRMETELQREGRRLLDEETQLQLVTLVGPRARKRGQNANYKETQLQLFTSVGPRARQRGHDANYKYG
jgi:hypothetical protein